MAAKLNKAEILTGILQNLVDGWGYGLVRDSLENLETGVGNDRKSPKPRKNERKLIPAVKLVEQSKLPSSDSMLLLDLARRFDEGTAFPKLGDTRAFLIAHHLDTKGIRDRSEAFRRMLPILTRMSEKGLEKVISRAHHSGPADLEPISKAIRGAGESMRGGGVFGSLSPQGNENIEEIP